MLSRVIARFSASDALVRRLLIACMALGFAMLIAAVAAAAWLTVQNREHTHWVTHTYEVELAIAKARTLVEQTETARRGFLLTADPLYSANYREGSTDLLGSLYRIGALASDNPRQRANVAAMRGWVSALIEQRDRTMALVESGQLEQARASFNGETVAKRMRYIRDLATAMTLEEQRLLAERDRDLDQNVQTFFLVLMAIVLLLGLVALISRATVARYIRDLDRSSKALATLNGSLEDQVVERTADLTRANDEIQRFAYIVSHDLRSPLVNVMGFTAELDGATRTIGKMLDQAATEAPALITRDVEMAVREDLPEAINFIRTSTAKMDRLINAILKLSREGRRVLAAEEIDVTALVAGIRDTLAHRVDEQEIDFQIEGTLPPIRSDRLALEQILSNLIENAAKYLSPDRRGVIRVRGARDGLRVRYEVSDNGRGIAPEDHSRVFDLFRRAGKQDTPGEGIGLAHVRALAYRLGGTVDVESVLGESATFRLNLPANFQDSGEGSQ